MKRNSRLNGGAHWGENSEPNVIPHAFLCIWKLARRFPGETTTRSLKSDA